MMQSIPQYSWLVSWYFPLLYSVIMVGEYLNSWHCLLWDICCHCKQTTYTTQKSNAAMP